MKNSHNLIITISTVRYHNTGPIRSNTNNHRVAKDHQDQLGITKVEYNN